LPGLPGRPTKSAVLAAGEYANFNAKHLAISNRRLAFQEEGSLQEASTRKLKVLYVLASDRLRQEEISYLSQVPWILEPIKDKRLISWPTMVIQCLCLVP